MFQTAFGFLTVFSSQENARVGLSYTSIPDLKILGFTHKKKTAEPSHDLFVRVTIVTVQL